MIKEQAAKGAFWSLVELLGGQVLAFASFLILARLLEPQDFGIITLATVIISIPQILVNQGFAEAIIQREVLDDDHLQTAFWSNMLIATVFTVATIVSAPFVADAFGYEHLEPVMQVLGVNFLFFALTSTHGAFLRRQLKFYTFAVRSVIGAVAGGVVAIWMALEGFGIWSLVANILVSGVVGVVVMWWGSEWQPRLHFSKAAFDDLYHFTTRTMYANLVQYTATRIDPLIVGAFLDVKSLGFYYLVARVVEAVERATIAPIASISVAVLSRLQGDRRAFNDAFLYMVWTTALLWTPMVAGIGAIADFLPMIFGEKWSGAVPLMQAFALVSITQPLITHTNKIMFASGQPQVFARLATWNCVTLVISVTLACRFGPGIVGVGFAIFAQHCFMILLHLRALRNHTTVSITDMLWKHALIVLSAAAMVAAVRLMANDMPHTLIGLFASVSVGISVYAIGLLIVARDLLASSFGTVRNMVMRKRTVV